jgi:hypothetical protein
MNTSVIMNYISPDDDDVNVPRDRIVSSSGTATSAPFVNFDEEQSEHCSGEDNDDDFDDDYDDDDDGEDTKKFPTPDSKRSFPGSEGIDCDVYYGDLSSFVARNFPPPSIDWSKLKGSDFSTEDDGSDDDNDDSSVDGVTTPPTKEE